MAEAEEKLARGLYILIREATNARNLHALLPHRSRLPTAGASASAQMTVCLPICWIEGSN
ncbi:MAG: hypothetical protein V9G23_02865 [Giesbergeria sp.]